MVLLLERLCADVDTREPAAVSGVPGVSTRLT